MTFVSIVLRTLTLCRLLSGTIPLKSININSEKTYTALWTGDILQSALSVRFTWERSFGSGISHMSSCSILHTKSPRHSRRSMLVNACGCLRSATISNQIVCRIFSRLCRYINVFVIYIRALSLQMHSFMESWITEVAHHFLSHNGHDSLCPVVH